MNTRGDIKARIKRELQMISTSTLFTDGTIEDAIWDATLWATDLYPFPVLEKAAFTESEGDYYFDYPDQFKSDSVIRLVIADQPYEMIDFEDWLDFKKNNPNQTNEFVAATYGRQYFAFPTPATALEVIVWGLIQPPAYTNDNNTTVFSGSESALNEAIMRKALSTLINSKDKTNRAAIEEKRAEKVLAQGWSNILGRRARFRRKDRPFFNVPNLFPDGNGNTASIGNFTRRS